MASAREKKPRLVKAESKSVRADERMEQNELLVLRSLRRTGLEAALNNERGVGTLAFGLLPHVRMSAVPIQFPESCTLEEAAALYLGVRELDDVVVRAKASEILRALCLAKDDASKWYLSIAAALAVKLNAKDARKVVSKSTKFEWFMDPGASLELRSRLIAESEKTDPDNIRTNVIVETHFVNVGGIRLLKGSNGGEQLSQSLEPPTSAINNLKNLAVAIVTTPSYTPILLQGLSGSGKTWAIRTLAQLCQRKLIELQLDDQIDSKTLLGSMASVQGAFAWVPGALTQAIHSGEWVLIEDVDSCPSEVLTALKPLFESGRLALPNRSTHFHLDVHPGFRLFATTTNADFSFSSKATTVSIEALTGPELEEVAIRRYEHRVPASVVKMVVKATLGLIDSSNDAFPRAQALRDLFKWLDRLAAFCDTTLSGRSDDFLTERIRKDIVLEGVDVFTGRVSSEAERTELARTLAVSFGLAAEVGVEISRSRRPEFTFDSKGTTWRVGRVRLQFGKARMPEDLQQTFAPTSVALRTLEQIAACVYLNEPCLLVGETGAGKTSMIQLLAQCCGKTLVVQNMHVQSDSTEFLGGFKPASNLRADASTLHAELTRLFSRSFQAQENAKFLDACTSYVESANYKKLCKAAESAIAKYWGRTTEGKKLKGEDDEAWRAFAEKVEALKARAQSKDLFSFVEGALVKALRNGDWILLDEVNLAASETLERLLPLLEDAKSSIRLTERGDVEETPRHSEFRLFAAMNPSTDFGKKNLPPALRSRFSEIYVDEISEAADLRLVVERFLGQDARELVEPVVDTFQKLRQLSSTILVDGNGQAPRYSLRTLVRSLHAARSLTSSQRFGMKRALYESFQLLFATSLDPKSYSIVLQELSSRFMGQEKAQKAGKIQNTAKKILVCNDSFWLDRGEAEIVEDNQFILTPHVENKLRLLARGVALKRYPILLQGPTSAGKTSLVAHLAKVTGNTFVRINNHEHTDLEEYLGSYVAGDDGKLVFNYGALVDAVRKGHWVVLDELNLAPSDVLEALNRLLDDNRELFLTETQETIKPHPNFLLFATQNPPGGAYGGRKQLSKAFRNRFIEIHVDEIPTAELETILEKRNKLPPSFTKAMVSVMKELQIVRSKSQLFAGKAGLITPRDLIRWADRDPRSYQELAEHGYRLLGERLRSEEERAEVKRVLERFCRSAVDLSSMYVVPESARHDLVWTTSMKRLFSLVYACAANKEPCLIVGETGLGKTRCVQAVASVMDNELVVLNCHQGTETADILGSLRPARGRGEAAVKLKELLASQSSTSLTDLLENEEVAAEVKELAMKLNADSERLFEWADGPLVSCMREGIFFLLDEISLAEDAVLERLNSVLEPGRTLTLAERGGKFVEVITAAESFRAFATMNPGGDFGKRELSPALRNRFTEIWLPQVTDMADFAMVGKSVLQELRGADRLAAELEAFVSWFNKRAGSNAAGGMCNPLSMRDVIAWTEFVRATASSGDEALTREMFAHGIFLTCLDGLGVGAGAGSVEAKNAFMKDCEAAFPDLFSYERKTLEAPLVDTDTHFGAGRFIIEKQTDSPSGNQKFDFDAPTTRLNLVRLLRAMQLKRAILLEGSPGVGKTSIVSAVARKLGRRLVRINLSEQTDFSDLIGSDLPVPKSSSENDSPAMEFRWSDGVFLQALQNGDWVLLDELNLASQSVLEGLNAVLDHRAEVFVPELNRTFPCHANFRVFACQNPLQQGGGRKGLPKSFLNRFTKVQVEALNEDDFASIAKTAFPDIAPGLVDKVIKLTVLMSRQQTTSQCEYNLRDVFRFCEMLRSNLEPCVIFEILYASRYGLNRQQSVHDFIDAFGADAVDSKNFDWYRVEAVDSDAVVFGNESCRLRLSDAQDGKIVPSSLDSFPSSLTPALVMAAQSLASAWPVLLVGQENSGKTLIISRLAALTGRPISVFQMTSGTDATELLGCFEQTEPSHGAMAFLDEIQGLLESFITTLMTTKSKQSSEVTLWASLLEEARLKVFNAAQGILAGSAKYPFSDAANALQNAFSVLMVPDSLRDAGVIVPKVDTSSLRSRWDDFIKRAETERGFRWVDGALVRAVERGEWLVLEDANLCSASVLDRLNSLLESGGELVVNEQGVVQGGGLRVCRPHKDFRVFLTVNPNKGGMVSRAMRNRCVEIYLEPQRFAPSMRDKMIYAEEDAGVQFDRVDLSAKEFVQQVKLLKARAGMGDEALGQFWCDLSALPRPIALSGDLERDALAAEVRMAFRLVSTTQESFAFSLKAFLQGVQPSDAKFNEAVSSALLLEEVGIDQASIIPAGLLVSALGNVKSQCAKQWLLSQLGKVEDACARSAVDACLKISEPIKLRRALESLVQPSSLTKAPRYLRSMFDALDGWLGTLEVIAEELLYWRDTTWRMFLSDDVEVSSFALNVIMKKLFKCIRATTSSLSRKSSEWTHLETVARRVDGSLPRPCLEAILNTSEESGRKAKPVRLFKKEYQPRPPTDPKALKLAEGILTIGLEESNVADYVELEESLNMRCRGGKWRREAVAALATLRYAGSGGGGPLVEKSNLRTLRDEAGRFVEVEVLREEELHIKALPIADHTMSVLETEVCQRVLQLSQGKSIEWNTCRALARQALDIAIGANCRSIGALTPLQELIWVLESENHVQDVEGTRMHLASLLPELLAVAGAGRVSGWAFKFPFISSKRRDEFIRAFSLMYQSSNPAFVTSLVRGSGLGVDAMVSPPQPSVCLHETKPISLQTRQKKRAELMKAIQSIDGLPLSVNPAETDLQVIRMLAEMTKTSMETALETLDPEVRKCIKDVATCVPSDTMTIAKAWTALGLIRYTNLAQECRSDPRGKPRVLREALIRERCTLQNQLAAAKLFRFWSVGGKDTTPEQSQLESRLNAVNTALSRIESEGVSIDREKVFERLNTDVESFMRTVGQPERVFALAKRLASNRADRAEAETFLSVCRTFVDRLVSPNLSACVDVTSGFIAAVSMAAHGIQILAMPVPSAHESRTFAQLMSWPRNRFATEQTQVFSRLGPRINTKLLLVALQNAELCLGSDGVMPSSFKDRELFREAFERITDQWRGDRKAAEERRLQKEAQVRVKSASKPAEELDETAQKEEDDFKRMFPNFHTEFMIKPKDDDDLDEVNIAQNNDEDLEELSEDFNALTADEIHLLVKSFLKLYGEQDGLSAENAQQKRSSLFAASFFAAADLASKVPFTNDTSLDVATQATSQFLLKSCLNDLTF